MAIEQVLIPDLGGADSVDVIELCVAVGDTVEIEDSLIVVETDKASLDVPSTVAGVIKAIHVAEGAKVNEGDICVDIETSAEATQSAPEAEAEVASAVEEAPAEVEVAPVAATAPASASASATLDIVVPDLGGADGVDVIEVCVAVGDEVSEGDSLIVLETDKASMEIPAEHSGKIIAFSVTEGGKVNEGEVIGSLQVEGGAAAEESVEEPEATAVTPVAASSATKEVRNVPAPVAAKLPPAATGAGTSNRDSHAGPAVRKLARELGVDLTLISPTGPRGRILKDDLHDFVKNAMKQISQGGSAGASLTEGATGIPPRPTVDFAKFGDVAVEPLSKIDRLTALNMQRSWLNVPHVTQFDDADITDLEEFRKSLKAEGEKRGVKVTPVAFLIKAVASALSQNPKFNSSLDAAMENRITKSYVNVGMAVDTPRGLVVPVIKDADKKGLWEIAADVIELSIKARDGKLKPNEMQGGCFTVSSLGAMGGTGFTPIVNTPEVGILGVSKAQIKPVWNGSEFIPRQMLPLALSYDHCAINGGDAGRFMTTIVAELSDVRRLILN
ncbi:dihydrolipoyllysine-residue acetyltransferase [uncultured Umboniibacter sp.]|uniref:dihydrolipoyllysine-residue acetyltransferase n=1 Tax=uncultured Umboniibacter sp. TaxID=1798917 RepID=UPI00262F45F0|nr:dihydrolipoyllysine-residue acetyltransferase [uncultured Umboniibacter sp.]